MKLLYPDILLTQIVEYFDWECYMTYILLIFSNIRKQFFKHVTGRINLFSQTILRILCPRGFKKRIRNVNNGRWVLTKKILCNSMQNFFKIFFILELDLFLKPCPNRQRLNISCTGLLSDHIIHLTEIQLKWEQTENLGFIHDTTPIFSCITLYLLLSSRGRASK